MAPKMPNSWKMKMKEKPIIVYVQDVEPLKLIGLLSEDQRYVGDPDIHALKAVYEQVRKKLPDLPAKVGVCTYHPVSKRHIKQIREEISEYPTLEGKTLSGYPELDVIEEMMAIGRTDLKQPLAEFMVYRNLMLLASCPLLTCDKGIEDLKGTLMMASTIPDRYKINGRLGDILKDIQDKTRPEFQPMIAIVSDCIEALNKMIPDWTCFESLYQRVKSRFDKNKVSRNFPLNVAPYGWFFPQLVSVSLEEGVDKPEYVDMIMPYLIAGAKAHGLTEVPERELAEINRFNKERFGRTKTLNSLDGLLEDLPERKIIFADVPIVDAISQIEEMPFDTLELVL